MSAPSHVLTMHTPPDFLAIEFVIVGGSISGLTTALGLARIGHRVTLVNEGGDMEVTALAGGCKVPFNNSKVYYRWGMGKQLKEFSVASRHSTFMSYETGQNLLGAHLEKEMVEETGGEFLSMHYANLRKLLVHFARQNGATIRSNAKVVEITVRKERPFVRLISGEVIEGDVVIGADGTSGLSRAMIIGDKEHKEFLNRMMFNVVIEEAKMREDPDLVDLYEQAYHTVWVGADHGAMGFAIGENQYSLHLWAPGEPDSDATISEVGRANLERALVDCEPRLMKIAKAASVVICVPVVERPHLENWVHPDGPLLVIGEAAHPILPGSQYAMTLATGDGFVLSRLFRNLSRKDQIPVFLSALQEIRQNRLNNVLKIASTNPFALSMPPGVEEALHQKQLSKDKADSLLTRAREDKYTVMQEAMESIYGYDPEDDADTWWVQWGIIRERGPRRLSYSILVSESQREGSPESA
ncbi:hypothetical protein BKA93DRAFT_602477 [Sparassis latifolia]|uniref:FAD/NAD(P)-binding domain-containing protein n=1 Tax=Sparassis crispa TaxID=139825 RepID=A0A401GGW5_9APHY|nr:FAD/NAD(P)-binding domain-containing protein [Sparassis crispa]GBE81361.1 FAD/NAD(P)-binding domain-containing protein [Sparassis crispa]